MCFLLQLCNSRIKYFLNDRVVWGNTIRGETPYEGAVAKTVPNLALKPTVMVGKIDVIMAISLRRCSCLCVYEVRNSKFRMSTAIFLGSNMCAMTLNMA